MLDKMPDDRGDTTLKCLWCSVGNNNKQTNKQKQRLKEGERERRVFVVDYRFGCCVYPGLHVCIVCRSFTRFPRSREQRKGSGRKGN